jgi:hypothetical protein
MGWKEEQWQTIKAIKDWIHDTPLRIWGWIIFLFAFIGGSIVLGTWLSKNLPPWYVWLSIALLVIGVIVISFVPYYKRVKDSRTGQDKPSIIVKLHKKQGIDGLEVKNIGLFGKFSAQVEVLEDSNNRLKGDTWFGYWELSPDHYESGIKNGHVDFLEFFRSTIDTNGQWSIEVIQSNPPAKIPWAPIFRATIPSENLTYRSINAKASIVVTPQIYKFRVVISSNPEQKGQSFSRDYEWCSDTGLKEI